VRGGKGVAFALILCGALWIGAPARAATVSIGHVAPAGAPGGCSGCTGLQLSSDPSSPSYVVPAGGPWTITSWSARGGATMADSARLRVFRETAVAGRFQLVAESEETPIAVAAAPANPVSIAVEPGDLIGLRTFGGGGDMPVVYPSAAAVDVFGAVPAMMVVGETAGPGGTHALVSSSFSRANVSATLSSPPPKAKKRKRCKKGFKLKKIKKKGKKPKKKCVRKKKRKKKKRRKK
jgi:hypothetical protein